MRSLLVSLALAAALALPTVASARPVGPIGSAFAAHASTTAHYPATAVAPQQHAGAPNADPSQPHPLADTVQPAAATSSPSLTRSSSDDGISTLAVILIAAGGIAALGAAGAGAARLRPHKPVPQV